MKRRQLASVLVLTAVLTACSGHASADGTADAAARAPSLPTPLATSVQTSTGLWATVPMGRLDQPLNTFWQLLYQPSGSTSWSNDVEATATATNGGLVLSSFGGKTLVVGVRPSADLKFTPLISTSNAAKTWGSGLIDATLGATPDALAAGPTGQELALVNNRTGQKVISAHGDLSIWRQLASTSTLARTSAGRSCGLAAVTAVGYLSGRPLIGASCGQPGQVGMFERSGTMWRLVGPALPAALNSGRSEVLALTSTSAGTSALLAVKAGRRTELVLMRSQVAGKPWRSSTAFALGGQEQVLSFGRANKNGVFVLVQSGAGPEKLMVSGKSATWTMLPSPPEGTATVAFSSSSSLDAIVTKGTQLTIWTLRHGERTWGRSQVIHVPIQYGSSS